MTNAAHRLLDPTARSAKYILLRLPHAIRIPPLCRPEFGCTVISDQMYHDQSLNARWLFINPQWPIFKELQAETAACTLIALLAEPLVRRDLTPSVNIPDRRRGDRRRGDLAVVKEFIDKSLALESLDVALIGHRFGMSRSSVYRLFESEGGLANYIRRRRLLHAFSLLVSPPPEGRLRILDVAVECGFSSDMVFARAFRKMFSLTPSAVRSMAALQTPEPGDLLTRLQSSSMAGICDLPHILGLPPKR